MYIAHEWRAWLIHYSAVVLRGILPDVYYQHHLLLAEAVYLLIKDVVRECDLVQSTRLLQHYCYLFSSLYGKLHHTPHVKRIQQGLYTNTT